MNGRPRFLWALGLLVVGAALAGFLLFLRSQSLDHAASWAIVVGFFVSASLGLAGVVLAWLTWRSSTGLVPDRTGRIRQRNRDGINIANTGVMTGTSPARPGKRRDPIARTGDLDQRNSGGANVANSGVLEGDDVPLDQPRPRLSRDDE